MTAPTSHLRLLAEVTDQLGSEHGGLGVADSVLPAVVEAFGATVGTLAAFRTPSTLRLLGLVGLDHQADMQHTWEEFDLSAALPLTEAARTGKPVWIPDSAAVRDQYPAWPGLSSHGSLCVVPMRSRGRLVGVLGLTWAEPREFSDSDRDTLCAVASIAAAACLVDGQDLGRRLDWLDSDLGLEGVQLAHLVRSTSSVVPRTVGTAGATGAPNLSWLVEAPNDLALGVACEGVLALARAHGTPPALAARDVADLAQELQGLASAVVLQVAPDAGWVAVAGVNECIVLTAPVMAGAGITAFTGSEAAADEHVLVPDGQGASVLALLLAPGVPAPDAARLARVALAEFERARGISAEDLLRRVGERLGEHGLDSALAGALALVVAPRAARSTLLRRFPARPLAAPLARRFALAAVGPEPGSELAFRLSLVVDELVTNATRHSDGTIDVSVDIGSGGVRVWVSDDDDRGPVLPSRPAAGELELEESGRGLLLVDALVDGWGVEPRRSGGKVVWAYLRA